MWEAIGDAMTYPAPVWVVLVAAAWLLFIHTVDK